eukprot:CAMPEP_0114506334 /NCGR_PEP_ID=MMETSP0109-20121206/11373_1 /TAXON_ID=29199 /ORGANISM="Chlorarachnion reptans, Strain CCCM449" /LENGTH=311 /DNA_ID=CAMNT_0001684917 /DNA_START=608 /DNA_END=1543 /DNA_ORIENTATION=+
MHSANIVHRDLKPSNILVNRKCQIRICDFGLARDIKHSNDVLTQYVVTRWYRAPEVICSHEYDQKIDTWSVGCIIAEMLGKEALFPGEDYVVQMKLMFEILGCPDAEDLSFIMLDTAQKWTNEYIKRNKERIRPMSLNERFPESEPECLKLLAKTLEINPKNRMTVKEALNCPYFRTIRKKEWEKDCNLRFKFKYSKDEKLTEKELKESIVEEVAHFRPEIRREESFCRIKRMHVSSKQNKMTQRTTLSVLGSPASPPVNMKVDEKGATVRMDEDEGDRNDDAEDSGLQSGDARSGGYRVTKTPTDSSLKV